MPIDPIRMTVALDNPAFWIAVAQIIVIDILLSGDNAVVIALACRNLPAEQRRQGVLWGVAGALGLRVLFTFFATSLLDLPFLKIIGGLLLLWIGVKLLVPESEEEHNLPASEHLWGAVRTIITADFVMSLDNVVAVAAAAEGSLPLILFGLAVSVPFIIGASQGVMKLMDRFPVIITAGGGLLGWVAGSMLVTDPVIHPHLNQWLGTEAPGAPFHHWLGGALGAVLVVALGRWLANRQDIREAEAEDA